MTGRERLHAVLNRQPTDRLSWTTLVDDVTRAVMPEEVRRLSPLDFYRHIGCDILQFGNYGLDAADAVPPPAVLTCAALRREVETEEDGRVVRRLIPADLAVGVGGATATGKVTLRRVTPWGTLTTLLDHDHPVTYPVQSCDELRVLRQIWEASDYLEQPGMEAALVRLEEKIGPAGIYVPTLDPSPVQNLLEYELGMANFYYLLADYRAEVEECWR